MLGTYRVGHVINTEAGETSEKWMPPTEIPVKCGITVEGSSYADFCPFPYPHIPDHPHH